MPDPIGEPIELRARRMLDAATPGPWEWHGYDTPTGGGPVLCTSRWGKVYVMEFIRRGMQGAKPRFWRRHKDDVRRGWGGAPDNEPWEVIPHNGRVCGARNPDAELIAAAPELIAGLLDREESLPDVQEAARRVLARLEGRES